MMSDSARWGRSGQQPDAWARTEEQQLPTYEAVLRRHRSRRRPLLDVGCGTGVFLRLCADRGASVSGIDATEGLLASPRTRVPEADLRLGDMQSLPFRGRRVRPRDRLHLVLLSPTTSSPLCARRRGSRGTRRRPRRSATPSAATSSPTTPTGGRRSSRRSCRGPASPSSVRSSSSGPTTTAPATSGRSSSLGQRLRRQHGDAGHAVLVGRRLRARRDELVGVRAHELDLQTGRLDCGDVVVLRHRAGDARRPQRRRCGGSARSARVR